MNKHQKKRYWKSWISILAAVVVVLGFSNAVADGRMYAVGFETGTQNVMSLSTEESEIQVTDVDDTSLDPENPDTPPQDPTQPDEPENTISYTVYYVDENGNQVATAKAATGSVDETVTEYAIDIVGYEVTGESVYTISLMENAQNTITFHYGCKSFPLIIHYVDEDGNVLLPDFEGSYPYKSNVSIPSPEIEGYTPDYTPVTTDSEGMPAETVEVTVVYAKNQVALNPDDPTDNTDTPDLGTGDKTSDTGTDNTATDVNTSAPADTAVADASQPASSAASTRVKPAQVEEEDSTGVIKEEKKGSYTIIPIYDDETPLANTALEAIVENQRIIFWMPIIVAVLAIITVTIMNRKRKYSYPKGSRRELDESLSEIFLDDKNK